MDASRGAPVAHTQIDAQRLWEQVRDHLAQELTAATFRTWVAPCKAVHYDGRRLVLAAPNAYTRDWLARRLQPLVERLAEQVAGHPVEVVFTLPHEPPPNTTAPNGDVALPRAWVETEKPDDGAQAFEVDGLALNPAYTFATFVVGASNEFAFTASRAVAERPGEAYNPLFIYGGVGLGKTHLLQAIAHALKDRGRRVVYLSAEAFFNAFIQALRTYEMDAFRRRFREVDALLVDDVHFLIGKERLQEEFFHTFNTLYAYNRQIVFTADRPPAALAALEERLRSRFEWGLIADIQPPDYETRLAIVRFKAESRGMRIPDDVLEYVARHIEGNIRTLEGALNRLWAYHELRGAPLTVAMAQAVLADLLSGRRWAKDPEGVLRVVAEEFGVTVQDLKGKSRARKVLIPRQVAMYLLREDLRLSFPQIGRLFGGKDHTTVMHAWQKTARAYEEDEALRKRIQRIRERMYG